MAEGRNLLDTVLGIASLTGLLAGGIWYATGLQNQLDAAQREITELRSKLDAVSTSTSSGIRGPKGDKGDTGDQGPRGERGPQGEMGPMGQSGGSGGFSETQIRQLVQQLVQQQIASTQNAVGTVQSSINGSDVFSTSGCTNLSEVRNLDLLTLRPAQEFCDQSGRLVARVRKFSETQHVYIERPGESGDSCALGYSCKLRWLNGKSYTYERYGEDENGPIALLRLKT